MSIQTFSQRGGTVKRQEHMLTYCTGRHRRRFTETNEKQITSLLHRSPHSSGVLTVVTVTVAPPFLAILFWGEMGNTKYRKIQNYYELRSKHGNQQPVSLSYYVIICRQNNFGLIVFATEIQFVFVVQYYILRSFQDWL